MDTASPGSENMSEQISESVFNATNIYLHQTNLRLSLSVAAKAAATIRKTPNTLVNLTS
jgi:hypothetical protein